MQMPQIATAPVADRIPAFFAYSIALSQQAKASIVWRQSYIESRWAPNCQLFPLIALAGQ